MLSPYEWLASMISAGAGEIGMERSSSIWSAGKSSTCCQSVPQRKRRRGSSNTRKLRSSAETGADFMRKEHGKARHRQSRSRIGFISCRIYARQSSSK